MEPTIRAITALNYAGSISTTVFNVTFVTLRRIIANNAPVIVTKFVADYWDSVDSALE